MGTFHKWKNYEVILKNHQIYVYSRPKYELGDLATHEQVSLFEAPLMDISASYIRKAIKDGQSIRYLVVEEVFEYIAASGLYK